MKKVIFYFLVFIATISYISCEKNKSMNSKNNIESKVDQIVSSMTIEEKVGQMTQITLDVFALMGENDERAEPVILDTAMIKLAIGKYKIGSVLNTVNNRARSPQWWYDIISYLQELSIEETGIPIIYGIDAIHGVNYTSGATLYPQQIGQGATFNPNLVKELNELAAYEMRASNIPWTFSPVLDMGRDPRDPRYWETYGEDVYLAQQLGAAAVEGFEGSGESIDSLHGASCIKHYLAYNSNSGKDRNPLSISVRELKEKHAASFQAAIDAGASTIMVNSGLINGYPVHANYEILTQLLRNEMGFDGMLVSDWADIENFHERDKITKSEKEAVKLAINAGIDMSMVPYNFKFCDYLIELVNEGEVLMSRIDEAVSRIIVLKLKLGLFENSNTNSTDYPKFASKEFEEKALEAAIESMTLLKNKNRILPLSKDVKVLVTGPNANTMRAMNGGWSYSWQGEKVEEFAQEYNTFLEAIKNKIGQKNVKFVEAISYNNNGKYFEEENIDIKSAVSAAKSVDYILLFLGENSYCEKPGDLKDLYISENQTELAQAMAKTGKPLILILNEGRPRLIRKFEREMDAIIQTYLPSNYGGDALAEVLFGDENPSGKLPYTYPNFPNSLITYDYKPAEKQEKQEGIYDYASDVKVQYEFGHGLSYTTFEYSELKINTDQLTPYGKVDISVKVKNTGSRTGKEVVMVYTSDLFATISPDNKRLRRFKKIELEPGEIKEVKFEISPRDLAFYNYDNQLVSEKGEFVLSVKDMMLEFNLTETVKFDEPSMVRL